MRDGRTDDDDGTEGSSRRENQRRMPQRTAAARDDFIYIHVLGWTKRGSWLVDGGRDDDSRVNRVSLCAREGKFVL